MIGDSIQLRKPTATDGASLHRLISQCPPLDTNSMYCNLLHCSHFAQTSVVAEKEGEIVGFISGYVVPGRADTLFIWQVAVSAQARGLGLASSMLDHIFDRPELKAVQYLETTITPGNDASWALFTKFSKTRQAPISDQAFFDKAKHFNGEHESEWLVHIGPISR